MPEVKINNSYCQLSGFSETILTQIRSKLTYTNEEVIMQKQMLYYQLKRAKGKLVYILKAKFAALGSDTTCWLDQDNKFPTGLLHIVKDVLKSTSYMLNDKRIKPESYNILRYQNVPDTLRYYQKEAVDEFLRKGRGVFQMAVGSGKTRIATEVIKQLAVNTLFVVPSSALLTQAFDIFVNAFGAKNVQKISTLDVKKSKKLKPVRVVTIQTLSSLHKQGLSEAILNDVDLFILDECHHSGSESFTKLLTSLQGIYYRLGLSGTYLRNDSKTLDLWGVSGEVIYDYNAAKATKEGYLTPVEFNIVPLRGKFAHSYQTEYKDNYSSLEFLEAIHDTISNKIPKDNQILILIERKAACGDLIYEFLKEKGISCTYMTGDNSKDEIKDSIENFNDKKIRILIGSQVFGEGCDIRSTTHLIMARGGKSEIAMTQAVGRAVRLYLNKKIATVWDFNFKFCKYLSKHLGLRVETYEKQFNGKINWLT